MFDDISLHGIYVTYECGTMAKWRSSLLTKVMGISAYLNVDACCIYILVYVEALVVLYTSMYYMPVGSISARDICIGL